MSDLYKALMQRQNQDQQSAIPVSDEDKARLEAYTKHLDTYDPKAAIQKKFNEMRMNQEKAMEIASRSPFADKTPEELEFEEKNLDPMTRGLIGGGPVGGTMKVIGNPAQISKLTGKAVDLFPKLKGMFQAGDNAFPAQNTAQALKVQDALEQIGLVNKKSPFGKVIVKD